MLICKNGVMVDEEIATDETMLETFENAAEQDTATALAEGLSKATNLAQVRDAAKAALEKE